MFAGIKSGLSRVSNYRAKVRPYTGTGSAPDYTAPVIQHKLTEMYRKQENTANEQATYTYRVKALLSGGGVQPILTGPYLAFAGQMYRITRVYSGLQRSMAAAELITLWTTRGLSGSILQGIRSDVFGVPPVS